MKHQLMMTIGVLSTAMNSCAPYIPIETAPHIPKDDWRDGIHTLADANTKQCVDSLNSKIDRYNSAERMDRWRQVLTVSATAVGSGLAGYGVGDDKKGAAVVGAAVGLAGGIWLIFFPAEEKNLRAAEYNEAKDKWGRVKTAAGKYSAAVARNQPTTVVHARVQLVDAALSCTSGLEPSSVTPQVAYTGSWYNKKFDVCFEVDSAPTGLAGTVTVDDERARFLAEQQGDQFRLTVYSPEDESPLAGSMQFRGDLLEVTLDGEVVTFEKAPGGCPMSDSGRRSEPDAVEEVPPAEHEVPVEAPVEAPPPEPAEPVEAD